MLLTFAFVLTVGAIAVGVFAMRRMARDEERSYVDELDNEQYDVDLDTPERQQYAQLLEEEAEGKATPNQMVVGLLNRAVALIPHIERVERDHARIPRMHRAGYVSGTTLSGLQVTHHELKAEVEDVRREAERLRAGWGKEVFAQAYHLVRKRRGEVPARANGGEQPPSDARAGTWTQTPDEMSLKLSMPPPCQREHVKVQFEPETIIIALVGVNKPPMRILTEARIKPAECRWELEPGVVPSAAGGQARPATLVIVLAKETRGMWRNPHRES